MITIFLLTNATALLLEVPHIIRLNIDDGGGRRGRRGLLCILQPPNLESPSGRTAHLTCFLGCRMTSCRASYV